MPRDRPRPPPLGRTSSGSYHAGAPVPSAPIMRRGSTHRYQTFPTQPPKTPIDGGTGSDGSSIPSLPSSPTSSEHDHIETPLPIRQLLLLAYLSLCEQTALNSISPYLPEMVGSMPGIPMEKGGVYVGTLASAFALAQLSTNFAWGYASDLVGRKPVLLAGTFSLMCCFCLFGFCTSFWQMVLVHVLMGMLNGNAACVPTVLGEVTDKSNQSKAFTYLPVIYSLGGITGPAVGGLLVGTILRDKFYFFAPNLVSAGVLATGVVAVALWFEETLDADEPGPGKPEVIAKLQKWFTKLLHRRRSPHHRRRQSWSGRWPIGRSGTTQPLLASDSASASSDDDEYDEDEATLAGSQPVSHNKPDNDETAPIWHELVNRKTLILLSTYLIFQLSNISFNSLYPIFAASKPPTGRGLRPGKIGVGLSIAGAATILFQAFLFAPVRDRAGSMGTYRLALMGIALSMVAMPWVGYTTDEPLFGIGSGKLWLYIELGFILIVKNVCAVGGLSSVMLLITNSAPTHASLGTLNGIAQTLSALGRSIGPFVSGGLFTLSTGIHPKGEAFVWCLFGGLAVVGWIGTLFINGNGLESATWEQQHPNESEGNV